MRRWTKWVVVVCKVNQELGRELTEGRQEEISHTLDSLGDVVGTLLDGIHFEVWVDVYVWCLEVLIVDD